MIVIWLILEPIKNKKDLINEEVRINYLGKFMKKNDSK